MWPPALNAPGGYSLREFVIVAQDPGNSPIVPDLSPDVGKLGHITGLVRLSVPDNEKTVNAGLDSAVMAQRVNFHADQFSTRTDFLPRLLALTCLPDNLYELGTIGRHQAVLVMVKLEIVGEKVLEGGKVAVFEDSVEQLRVHGLEFSKQAIG